MKVGILTIFHTGNYGATLQAFATKQKLCELGADAQIIPYSSKSIDGKIDRNFIARRGLFGTAVALVEKLYYYPRMKKTLSWVSSFAPSETLPHDQLASLNDKYDIFIAGSDQIWNPEIQHGDQTYLLDFVTDNSKKCSYASSFGCEQLNPADLEAYRKHLSTFRILTVRETSGADIVAQVTGSRPPVVADPVLLLSSEEWEALLPGPALPAPQPTIFVYQMAHSGKLAKIASAFGKATHSRIEFVPFPIGGICRCKISLAKSPLEWLRSIHDASWVLTDSFHGMVFAILFHVPFYYVLTSDTVKRRSSRATTLLNSLGLSDRLISDIQDADPNSVIDWEAVEKKLHLIRKYSFEQIERMLNVC